MHKHSPPSYLSFLLRLYRVHEEGKPGWRVFLEEPISGEQYRFNDLESLFEFLRRATATHGEGKSYDSDEGEVHCGGHDSDDW